MKKNLLSKFIIIMIIATSLFKGIIFAQVQNKIEVVKLKDNFYRLTSKVPYDANFLAYVTKDGILLIDAGQIETSSELKDVLKSISIGNSSVKIIINTHAHIDLTGGNIALAGEPTIIGVDILRSTLKNYTYVINEFPDNALPSITFTDSLNIYFGDEKIKLFAVPGSHDGTDILVHFTKSNIVCMGDISYGMSFPSIDGFTGNYLNYPIVIKNILSMIPKTVTIISGHGKDCNYEELKQYGETIDNIIKIVQKGLAEGKTVQTLSDEDILKPWSAYGLEDKGDRDYAISVIAVAGPSKFRNATIKELYDVLLIGDGNAAVAKYQQLKKDFPGQYNFNPNPIIRTGKWLVTKNRLKDAIILFDFCTKEFPKVAIAYENLAEAYLKDNNIKLAIENYEKVLKLNPQNINAIEQLKKLNSNK